MSPQIPTLFQRWFAQRGWRVRAHQSALIDAYEKRQSTLLIAPTGSGKTLSGFLPALMDLHQQPHQGMHTLYISPLKALTNDIQRNLLGPIEEMGLGITVETRTGDTPSHKRQRQRRNPPHILLTTPESLMLMLSYADAGRLFSTLELVVLDEVHSIAHTKRGDLTSLALANLMQHCPDFRRVGLSATVAQPDALAQWMAPAGRPAHIHQVQETASPRIALLHSEYRMPYGGFMASYAMKDVYAAICEAQSSIVFVNTRAQAELVFQHLWDENTEGLPIAVYHGALSKEQRRKTEAMMAAGHLRAIVSTSALELGVDWGDIDLVIQIGAPKGVSRLLQRIGRSNHRMDEPSRAMLVPANRFEALECMSAQRAISQGRLDGECLQPGSLDVVAQFILNCACSQPVEPDDLYRQLMQTHSYRHVSREVFDELFRFVVDGGYALQHYDRYQRLEQGDDGRYKPASRTVVQRHRQNIGTIVEAARLKVKRVHKAHRGKIIGEVEEYFAQSLSPGDTFLFAGEVLSFVGVTDMVLEARPAQAGEPKIPSYVGGQMPLSTFLADGVRQLLQQPAAWSVLPEDVQEWLALQATFSAIPGESTLLVEQFPYRRLQYTLFYTFEGRKANQTLGMLLTRRMERAGLKPVSFSVTDYGLSIASVNSVKAESLNTLLTPDILLEELEEWMMDTSMLKRSFRHVATISGLVEQRYAGSHKTMKQVTFSTDILYDVLRRYDPYHILLHVTRQDAERELLDLQRLGEWIDRYHQSVTFKPLSRVSPMAIPIVLDVRSERVRGSGIEALLNQASVQEEAEELMEAVRQDVEAIA